MSQTGCKFLTEPKRRRSQYAEFPLGEFLNPRITFDSSSIWNFYFIEYHKYIINILLIITKYYFLLKDIKVEQELFGLLTGFQRYGVDAYILNLQWQKVQFC